MTAKSRKELLRREDAFITAAEQSAAWVNKYRTALLAITGAVVLAAAGVWGTSEYLHKRDRDASVIFAEGLRVIELGKVVKPGKGRGEAKASAAAAATGAEMVAKDRSAAPSDRKADGKQAGTASKGAASTATTEGAKAAADADDADEDEDDAEAEAEAAGEGDAATQSEDEEDEDDRPLPTFASEEEKWKAALSKFELVVDKAGMRGVGVMAALFVADLQAKLGDKTGAQTTFQGVQNALNKNDHLFFLAAERTAYLREIDGDVDGAIAVLDDIAGDDKRFFADYAQVHQARLFLKKDDKDRAKTILEHVEHAFPHSSLSEDVRLQLAELGVVSATEPLSPSMPGLDGTPGANLPTGGQP